ncbi:hypothetical protein V494_07697 [Pseudogymnoascus sp. VKM F-4513 (FW-928)]|nr:hypothetical protein V494_07697 [Pseudogymnoascus sp. VKM F-4513 (FW-928)]
MYPPRAVQIILDFDGTITTKDTIEPLVQSAISHHHPSLPRSELSQTPVAEAWRNCKSQYLADLSAHYEKENREPDDDSAVTGLRALDREQRALDALKDVELASVERVGKAGIFEGVSRDDFREMGWVAMSCSPDAANDRSVTVREGFAEFVTWARKYGAHWGVVSVNWSFRWVKGVLDVALADVRESGDSIPVYANDADGLAGTILGYHLHRLSARRTRLLTTADKLLAQKIMLSRWDDDFGLDHPPFFRVYIGDSPTDLSPLLHAHVGIIMNSASSTPGALSVLVDKCGYRVLPVSQYKELYGKGEHEKAALFLCANNFKEIMDSGMLQDEEWDPTAAKEAWKIVESAK